MLVYKAIPPPFFFRLASNAFPDIGSVGRIEVSQYEAVVPQDDVKTFTYLD